MINLNNQKIDHKQKQRDHSYWDGSPPWPPPPSLLLKLNNQQLFDEKMFQGIPPFGPYPTLGMTQSIIII